MWSMVLLGLVARAGFATTYYVAPSGSDALAGTTWATAKQTIQAAIDLTVASDLVLVSNGVYNTGGRVVFGAMTNRIAITNAITVRSVNGPALTVIQGLGPVGSNAIRCAYVGTNAMLSGFTLTNGATLAVGNSNNERSGGGAWCEITGIISNCVIVGNAASLYGGGSWRGTNYNCTYAGNSAVSGGGAYFPVLYNCVVSNNSSTQNGGGIWMGSVIKSIVTRNAAGTSGGGADACALTNCVVAYNTAALNAGGVNPGARSTRNCVFVGNRAGSTGGGISVGNIYPVINCTFIGNSALNGGGISGGQLLNCIVYNNQAVYGENVNAPGGVTNSCVYPLQAGAGNITNNPAMASVTHISIDSPCRGAGGSGISAGSDIDGEAWLIPPSMGADEIDVGSVTGPLTVQPLASLTNVAVGFPIEFQAVVEGRLTRSTWNFGDGTVVTNRAIIQRAFASPDTFPVVLTAFNETFPAGIARTVSVQVAAQTIHYVRPINPSASAPFTSWATAATNIQDAVDAATQIGALVLVTNGNYRHGGKAMFGSMTNRVAIDKMLTVRSVNGPLFTSIVGAGPTGAAAVRCVYVANQALLSGFTLTNGTTTTTGDVTRLRSGGGTWCESYGTVSNCVYVDNTADQRGGGAMYGYLYNCVFFNNRAITFGGGASEAIVTDSLFTNNTMLASGGGAGSYAGIVTRCTYERNSSPGSGGGASGGTLYNCILRYNSTARRGGGAVDSTLYNSAVYRNAASERGGGLDICRIYNCTVVGNSSYGEGGGVYNGSNVNSIVFYNDGALGGNWAGPGAYFMYSCTTPSPVGFSNITTAPLLGSLSHLAVGSPCIGVGLPDAASGVDVDGEVWLDPPSMGCDEINPGAITGALSVLIRASSTNLAVGGVARFDAEINGRLVASAWNFGDGVVVSNLPMVTHSFATTGVYSVKLSAVNESFPAGISATVVVQVTAQTIHYVNVSNATPAAPYTSWETAATNIQHAINASTQVGALILVTNGTYNGGSTVLVVSLKNRVAINRPVTVRSVNGPAVTHIVGDASTRCVYVGTNATLSGFTLRGGSTAELATDYYAEGAGAGVWCESSGLVSNCIITANAAYYGGGGCYWGVFRNCTIANNAASFDNGGGAVGSTMYSCLLVSNVASVSYASGGGASYCLLYDCTLVRNTAGSSGGGAANSTLIGCIVITNSALTGNGGGVAGGTLSNCVLTLNTASARGGGASGAEIHNSVISSNAAPEGGGAYSCVLNACDLVGNRATIAGGGSHSSPATLCRYFNNTAPSGVGGGAFGGDGEALLINCLLTGNSASSGGGASDVEMANCTLAGNSATVKGGGLYVSTFGWASIYNCIIYHNSAPTNANWITDSVDVLANTCTTPLPLNPTCITGDPQFVSLAVTNLRLQASSPCINTGLNFAVKTILDLDGNPRISGGTVDLGAYETLGGLPDSDGDGMPDAWETQYGLSPAVSNAPGSNADGDWMTDLEEYWADTNPTNGASFLPNIALTNSGPGTMMLVISTTSIARVYGLTASTNLLAVPQSWMPLPPEQSGSGTSLTFVVTNIVPTRIYRAGVRLP